LVLFTGPVGRLVSRKKIIVEVFMKSTALFLVLIAGMTLFTGCGKKAEGAPAGTAAPGSGGAYTGPDKDIVNPKGQFPLVKQPVSLTVALVQNARISDYDNNEYTKLLEERTGVDMVFNLLPSKDARSKVSLMFASNDLPDVFSVAGNIDDSAILEYGMDGLIIPLDPLIEHFGDEVFKMWDKAEDKNLKALMTSADGHIYSIPKYSEQYINLYNQRCFLYGPWMDTLGLKPAKTIAEYTELLRAFKNRDPNGNGKKDEIPLISFSGGDGKAAMYNFFLNAFVYWDERELMEVSGGKLSPVFVKDEYRDALVWLNSLVKEGLLDPATFTQDEPSLKAVMNQDTMVVGSFAQGPRTGVLDTNGERSKAFIAQPPLEGPKGVKWSLATPPDVQKAWQITRVCKYPAAAYRLADFMLNYDITFTARFGFEGRDWEKISDPSRKGIDGGPAAFRLVQNVWAIPSQNIHWQWPNPGFLPYGTMEGMLWDGDPKEYNYFQIQYGLNYARGLQPPESLPRQLVMNAAEAEVYANIRPTIQSYVIENAARFIVGDRPLSEWNAYVAEFDKMGLNKLVDTLQGVYTRMKGN
jgi:putative aldouronate transport system substrate-binding protein